MTRDPVVSASRVVRVTLGTATVGLLLLAFAADREPRLFAAAAIFGTMWWSWDLLMKHVFEPLADWVLGTVVGSGLGPGDPSLRPTLDELVVLLERHLERPTSQKVDINAAIRLEEIYRIVRPDPAAARRVIATVRARYPDAPELRRFADVESGTEPI
jgi:hypothetical protein